MNENLRLLRTPVISERPFMCLNGVGAQASAPTDGVLRRAPFKHTSGLFFILGGSMGKRFSETEKWRDKWFRCLKPSQKLLWLYLLDACDGAGVWNEDLELAGMLIGEPVTESDIESLNNGKERVKKVYGDRWQILDFIGFQYGTLSESCKPHKYVLGLLAKHGLALSDQRVSKGYPKGIQTLKDKDKEKDKDKDKDKEVLYTADFEKFWELHPGGGNKLKAFESWKKLNPNEELQSTIKAAIEIQKTWRQWKEGFIQHGVTWLNQHGWEAKQPAEGNSGRGNAKNINKDEVGICPEPERKPISAI